MNDTGVDLELVVSADREVTVPASELARLPVVPGQRVRVRVEAASGPPGRCSARWSSRTALA